MAKHKKGDEVKYRAFRRAKVVDPNPNKQGRIEIVTEGGTHMLVDEADVKTPKGR